MMSSLSDQQFYILACIVVVEVGVNLSSFHYICNAIQGKQARLPRLLIFAQRLKQAFTDITAVQ